VRVLLVDAPGRGLAFARELTDTFADVVVSTTRESEVPSVLSGCRGDLLVLARDEWGPQDTALCRRLRESDLGVALLAVSGRCDLGERTEALRAGVDEFVNIPFEAEEVVVRAFAAVRRAKVDDFLVRAVALVHGRSSDPGYARAGAFLVDSVRHQIFVEGRRIQLTLSEYDVLAMLIERSGEVVPRRELALRIDSTAASGSNIVDVHMSRIREKLADHASAIETVRGLGYRLCSR
jgi:DNA-binding response OmpR family regulator